MIDNASCIIFDDVNALSKGLSNYPCNSSLSNELILKLGESALMSKLDYDIWSLGSTISHDFIDLNWDGPSEAKKGYNYLLKHGWNYHGINGSFGSKSHFGVHRTSYAILLIFMWSFFVFKVPWRLY